MAFMLIKACRIAAIVVAFVFVFMSLYLGIESLARGGSFWHARITWTPAVVLMLVGGALVLGFLSSRYATRKGREKSQEVKPK